MTMLDTNTVKVHLRVRHEHDDAYIESLVAAAQQAFNDQTNRTLVAADADLAEAPANAVPVNKAIEQGMLLLIGHWYVNREATVVGTIVAQLPLATKALWSPYRWSNVG